MRVVSYIRMSTSRQELSPGQQRAAIESHARKAGYVIAREYSDLGISGDRTDKRVGFQAMIADGAAGKFDRIVVYDRSRFGRFDSIEFGHWVTPLREAGVELETLDRGVEDWSDFGGRVLGLVEQEGKHQMLMDRSRDTVRGLTAKAVEGRGYCGPTPFGYVRHTEVINARGNRSSTLSLHPDRAAVVREMFERYARPDGSLAGVAEALNTKLRVPTCRAGKLWRANAVRRILTNEVYVGDTVWGRRQKGRYHARQGTEIVRRKRGAKVVYIEPIRHQNTVPAIVSRELFARVQKLLAERTNTTRKAAKVRPLSGLVYCEGCGRPMHSDGHMLRCQSSSPARHPGQRCPAVRIPTAPLVTKVLEGLRERLAAPAARRKIAAALERQATARAAKPDDRRALAAKHAALVHEVAQGLERIPLMDTRLVADYAAALAAKAEERDRLAAELAARPKGVKAGPRFAVREALARIDELVAAAATDSPPAVNQALRALGVRVQLQPKKGPLDAEIVVGDSCTPAFDSAQVPRMAWKVRIA